MKALSKTLILLILASLFFSTSAFAKSDQAKLSLVSLGDSIPYGYNLTNNDNATTSKEAFPYLIGEATDMRVRNLAIPGWRTDQMLNALQNDQKYRQAVRHADTITLTIGNNDLLAALRTAQARSGGSQDLFLFYLQQQLEESDLFTNLGTIITEIRSLTSAPVVVYNVYNPFQKTDPLHYVANSESVLPSINQHLLGFVGMLNTQHSNILLADAYHAFGDNQQLYVIAGDIHPTVAGQQKLAEIAIKLIK
ncbi:SGNH/GDSL hydrolase family protein [Halalkalibacter akibai]|uniref:Lipase/Acylhydrolase with GDSL-like motif in BtlB locus n=1 Tax=Halalkalibacter akibai (strain ATCC 43226 / DSM 21942 / CIP 109018 / JCM 9157 / 1139) TaxID=1236973 RepID=W4QQV8_HALA3|nr:GDSL-type esterase/lipase family protein [Halalkalibacter akibai]GAE34475.1 lipase/Acylhydrolase with GDSL-like motif in BtlB locus [Halalkalibacter akibai JCM 9157]